MQVGTKVDMEARELEVTVKAAVAQAMTERENLKSDPNPVKVGSSHITKVWFTLVLFVFLGSCLYNYLEMKELRRPVDETVVQRIDAMDVHLYTIQARIQNYRTTHGRYPASLDELGVPEDGSLDYSLVSKKEFNLHYRVGEVARSYNSKESPERLLQGEFTRVAFRGRAPAQQY